MNNNIYTNPRYLNPNQMIPNINMNNNYDSSFVEDYLKKNIGKIIEAHVSFCDSIEWRDSLFTGRIEAVGKDYIAINNNLNTFVIWNIYIDYIVIKEKGSN